MTVTVIIHLVLSYTKLSQDIKIIDKCCLAVIFFYRMEVEEEQTKDEKNPALFGLSDSKKCICQIPGQVPCSGAVILPPQIRGRHRYTKES